MKAATAWWAWMGKLSGRGTRGRAGGRGSSRARLSAALHRRHEGGDATSIEHRRLSLRGIKTVSVLVSINYCSWTDLISQKPVQILLQNTACLNSSGKTALYLVNFYDTVFNTEKTTFLDECNVKILLKLDDIIGAFI